MNGRLGAAPVGPDPFADGLPALTGVACVGAGGVRPAARIRLRAPRQPSEDGGADVRALWRVFSDVDTLRYWSHEPFADRAQAAEYLAGIARVLADRSLFQWAVTEARTDALVGTVTLLAWDRAHRRCEIGFILRRDAWGQGYASEAVRAAVQFAFAEMDVHRIEADVDPDNAASLALLARLGFRTEGRLAQRWFTFGEWRDSVLLGLLASDYAEALASTEAPHSPS